MTKDTIIMYCAGDVGPNRDDPDSMFRSVAPALQKGDVNFCQLELNLTKRGTPLPQARLPMRADPAGARAIRDAGFHVVSFASNHCMDWGRDAFFDTIDALTEQKLAVIGVGATLVEARKPAILECKGTRIAFLAYNSVLPMAYWAEENRPGCVPLRAFTVYEQIEHDQPGTPCRVHTFPHKADLAAMVDDIRTAKSQADLVIVSTHWGVHFIPAVIADYEKEIGHAAIDAGADLIVGHHQHILKGIEVYKGKVIFHGLSNFALEFPFQFDKKLRETASHKEIQNLNPEWEADPEYPMPPDTRKTILVKCMISNKTIEKVSFLPAYLTVRAEPELLTSGDKRFMEVTEYMKEITRSQGFDTQFVLNGNEVIVTMERF
jgi:poly-gamma-glutamate capsule biosynthesis protein CapA/YwtB (metallophosphatase superfamily)